MLIKYIKTRDILFYFTIVSINIIFNSFIIHYINPIYLTAFYNCIAFWILSESHLLIIKHNELEKINEELKNKNIIINFIIKQSCILNEIKEQVYKINSPDIIPIKAKYKIPPIIKENY